MGEIYTLTERAQRAYRTVLWFLIGIPVLGIIDYAVVCYHYHALWSPHQPVALLIAVCYYVWLLMLQLNIPTRIEIDDRQRLTIISLLRRREIDAREITEVRLRRLHPYLMLPYSGGGVLVLKTPRRAIMLPLRFEGIEEFLLLLKKINPEAVIRNTP